MDFRFTFKAIDFYVIKETINIIASKVIEIVLQKDFQNFPFIQSKLFMVCLHLIFYFPLNFNYSTKTYHMVIALINSNFIILSALGFGVTLL